MKSLQTLLERQLQIRVIGFDDAPFTPMSQGAVYIAGVVCAGTVFEGLLWGEVGQDGHDATNVLVEMVRQSKYYEQVHLVLIDGLAFGGFNLVDLPQLAGRLDRPCIAVMRKPPDLVAVKKALAHFEDCDFRCRLLEKAGPIHHADPFFFQVVGESPEIAAAALNRISNHGHVPEALRIAHLIGSAVVTGQSCGRA